MSLNNSTDLSRAATEARGLAMDAVAACHSGHLGLPLGAAEIGSVLYGSFLRHDPAARADRVGDTCTSPRAQPRIRSAADFFRVGSVRMMCG